jgi:hypothetical protein
MPTYWKFVETRKEYNIWKSKDGFFQTTKAATPPDTTAGYAILDSLLKLKGLK